MLLHTAAQRPDALLEDLLAVWEASVRATHHFLDEADIRALRPCVRQALAEIPLLVYAHDGAVPLGFLGVADDKVEMLFLAPEHRGRGLGRAFVKYATDVLGASFVDVNEQNREATDFYRHLGFTVFARSELDGQGRPFPLLHMRREGRK